MSTLKDFLGFVVNPPPGDASRTAGSDQLGANVILDTGSSNPSGDYSVIKEAPLNPKWAKYGAKFDGSTDDAAAIQACMNDLVVGGEMYWPGDAIVGSTLTFPFAAAGKCIITGFGVGKSRARQKAGTTLGGVFQIGDGRNNVELEHIEIDQSLVTGGTTSQQMGVYVIGSSAGIAGLRLRDLYIHGGPQYGIRYQNNGPPGTPLEIREDDVRVEGFALIGKYSAGFNATTVPSITKGRILGGWVKGCGSDGAQWNAVADFEMFGHDCTDQTAGHGCVFGGTTLSRFTYTSIAGSNQLTNVNPATGVPAIGQTVAGGIAYTGLGVLPTGVTITNVTGTGPYTLTLSANAIGAATGATAVSGYYSHNVRTFGGEFSRNDPTNAASKIGLVFSVGSYDFQANSPRCQANGAIGLSVDVADTTFTQVVYDVGGRIVAPICSESVGSHGMYYNWAGDGLTIIAPRLYGNKGNGLMLVGTRALIVGGHLTNNTGYGWASTDAGGHTGAPPCGGHKFYALQNWGNTAGASSDTATVPSTVT
jgi:hypothetical protein